MIKKFDQLDVSINFFTGDKQIMYNIKNFYYTPNNTAVNLTPHIGKHRLDEPPSQACLPP